MEARCSSLRETMVSGICHVSSSVRRYEVEWRMRGLLWRMLSKKWHMPVRLVWLSFSFFLRDFWVFGI